MDRPAVGASNWAHSEFVARSMNAGVQATISQIRALLCERENARIAKLNAADDRRAALAAFNGHICDLPTGVKTYQDMYWLCPICRQHWHIKVIANVHRWQMFGRAVPSE